MYFLDNLSIRASDPKQAFPKVMRLPGGLAQILTDGGHKAPTLGNLDPGRTESGCGEN